MLYAKFNILSSSSVCGTRGNLKTKCESHHSLWLDEGLSNPEFRCFSRGMSSIRRRIPTTTPINIAMSNIRLPVFWKMAKKQGMRINTSPAMPYFMVIPRLILKTRTRRKATTVVDINTRNFSVITPFPANAPIGPPSWPPNTLSTKHPGSVALSGSALSKEKKYRRY